MSSIYNKYAKLLTNYCLEVTKGDRVYITSTYLAEPLLQEMLKEVSLAGGHPVLNVRLQEHDKIMLENSEEHQLTWENPITRHVMENFECYINIRAPFNLKGMQNVSPAKSKLARTANRETMKIYSKRTATRDLRRSLCQFPTQASAQEAGMSLSEYQNFVFQSCYLFEDDPIASWEALGKFQQTKVDYLNQRETIRYKNDNTGTDITFSCKGRTWMNSDGRTNMPSGEVYTAPVDDSANGVIRFTYPSIYMGQEAENVVLTVKDGEVVKWEATRGMDLLNQVFDMPGARRFGEAAIGTNMNIQRMTKNILFDEKIGGTIHMAVGQAYQQCGGKNESAVHWDMITDMTNGGEIFADGELIYKNGKFVID